MSAGAYWGAAYWGAAHWGAAYWGTAPAAPDLLAAVLDRLAATPAAVAGFGHDAAAGATSKFHPEKVEGGPDPPWLRVEETGEALSPETAGDDGLVHYVGKGGLAVHVVAAGKLQARQLRAAVVAALDDAGLAYADGGHVALWADNVAMPPTESTGVGAATLWQATATFTYFVDRTS